MVAQEMAELTGVGTAGCIRQAVALLLLRRAWPFIGLDRSHVSPCWGSCFLLALLMLSFAGAVIKMQPWLHRARGRGCLASEALSPCVVVCYSVVTCSPAVLQQPLHGGLHRRYAYSGDWGAAGYSCDRDVAHTAFEAVVVIHVPASGEMRHGACLPVRLAYVASLCGFCGTAFCCAPDV